MSVLTDTNIENMLSNDEEWSDESTLNIFPYSEKCLTPVGYDLRAGGKYVTSDEGVLIELKVGRR